jgi:hypothetical protein
MAKDSKTIGVTIRLWNVKDGDDFQPGHSWAAGSVTVQANSAHGIKAGESFIFNQMSDLMPKLEEALKAAGIKLHIGQEDAKLYKAA